LKISVCLMLLCATLFAQIPTPDSSSSTATVIIKNGDGKVVGKGVFSPVQTGGIKLNLTMTGFSPGKHAFHIHQNAVCDPKEEFDTAGLRFDPTHEFYGDTSHRAHAGPSAGDPGQEVDISPDGTGHGTYLFPKLTIGDDDHSILRGEGTAIVFHSSDNSNGPTRIACGVIARAK
jgi:superoxide dismutase, Cu-Zn family